MNLKRGAVLLLMLAMGLGFVADARADISNAAVLFLRIAPGARAAGMGEAFVAVADDATATHWNPAGLGTYPLADMWIDSDIPGQYRPVKGMAVLKPRGGDNYTAFDLWVLSPQGLLRYDNRRWYQGEVFATRTDQTLRGIVSKYFGITDETRLDDIVARVAVANSPLSRETLEAFRDSVMAVAPADYPGLEQFKGFFDSTVVGYNELRINWTRVEEAQSRFHEGIKDGSLDAREMDRIGFAIEKSRTRFIPEEITLPYASLVSGEMTSIASANDYMVIGTTNGLMRFNGRAWQAVTVENGLPSNNVSSLNSVGASILVGTDQGLAWYNGTSAEKFDSVTNCPTGNVTALGGTNPTDVFAVVDNQLYRYDGVRWSNNMPYTVVLGDTPEKIAAKFSLYASADEQAAFVGRIKEMNSTLLTDTSGDLTPGTVIQIPMVSELKTDVRAIHVSSGDNRTIWLGTEHGVFSLTTGGWSLPGYKLDTIENATNVNDFALTGAKGDDFNATAYAEALKALNNLSSDEIPAGTVLRVRANPAAAPVRDINTHNGRTYFATSEGLLELDGREWGRSNLRGLGDEPTTEIVTYAEQNWMLSDNRIVARAKGHSEVTAMYVKWLPDLASDLYYAYFGYVGSTESWGTFGLNATYISYGSFNRTTESGTDVVGTFNAFDLAVTGSYGTSLTQKLKAGVSAKVIYSKLADQGAGAERGKGSSTGFAVDLGLLYHVMPRLNLGMAITNIGPKMTYIDASQSDDLPRNLSVGLAYKVLNSEYNRLLITAEANKMLVGLSGSTRQELQELIFNFGTEFTYADLISARGGYIYDQEGAVKLFTVGAGLKVSDFAKADFAYIPSQKNSALNNILRFSLSLML